MEYTISLPTKYLNTSTLDTYYNMAPKSLLRYIFRHGPNSKARTTAASSNNNTRTSPSAAPAAREPVSSGQHQPLADGPESPLASLAYKNRSISRQSVVLEDIKEENPKDASSTASDKASIAETLAALDLDIDTFTTRGLITASVDEARMGNYAHLDTVNTVLELLNALEGLSATIDVLREEIEGKKRVCEEKLAMLEDACRMVAGLQFGEEE